MRVELATETTGEGTRWRRRGSIAILLAAIVTTLVMAASASAACTRPPNTIWTGTAEGPHQHNTWESFVKVEPESPPGGEHLEFNGRTTVTGEYEFEPGKFVPEAFTGGYAGTVACTGAEEFQAELEGTLGPYSGVKTHVNYVGGISGTQGSGTWENNYGEKGTWKASLFAVAESAGSRSGEVEMVNPSSSTATALFSESAPPGLPEGVIAPVGSLSYEVTELKSSIFDITFKLPPGSHPTGAYKLVGGSYIPYPAEKTKIEGEQVTLELQDNGPYDENPAVGTLTDPIVPVASNVPEFGRCLKAHTITSGKKTIYLGKYTGPTCITRSSTNLGKYEWYPGVEKGHFETSNAPPSLATFETPAKVKVACTGEHASGDVVGAKSVEDVSVLFTGCASGGHACSSSGLLEGEVESSGLEGVIGIEKSSVKAGKETRKAALDLYPVGKSGAFLEYECVGGAPTTLSGSVIAPVPTDKMFTTATVKYGQSKGTQKPERFEGGEADVLTNSLSQRVGLGVTTTQSNEEPFEINAIY